MARMDLIVERKLNLTHTAAVFRRFRHCQPKVLLFQNAFIHIQMHIHCFALLAVDLAANRFCIFHKQSNLLQVNLKCLIFTGMHLEGQSGNLLFGHEQTLCH